MLARAISLVVVYLQIISLIKAYLIWEGGVGRLCLGLVH